MQRLTASHAEAAQRRAAGAMSARRLTAGDRVLFSVPGSAELLCAVLGALRVGIVPVVLDPSLTPAEREPLVDDAEPALMVDDHARLAALDAGSPTGLAVVPLARPMHYTPGTTGRRKGVWSGVHDEAAAHRLAGEEAELWGFEAGDRHLVCSPLHHSAPIRFAVGTLLAGGEVLLPGPFDAALVGRILAAERPTSAFMVPAHLRRLLPADEGGGAAPPLGSLRLLAHAGAPCPGPLKRAAIAACRPGALWEFYGSTEGQFTAVSSTEWEARPGTVGQAREGRRLSTDSDGTIWCEVPDHARFSYWRDPDRTAAAWRGRAFTVGDLARLHRDGYLFLDGRRDDLVISGGVNVYPAEVEDVLSGAPGVVEAAVFGADDERWGQRVCAAVVGDVDAAVVLAHARTRLSRAKVPKEVFVVDRLPRTSTGKVRRLALPAELRLT